MIKGSERPFFPTSWIPRNKSDDKNHPFALTNIIQAGQGRWVSCAKITTLMTVVFLLILISLIVALGFLGAFFWAVKSGQYDDEYTPSVRILFDEKQKEND